MFQEAWPASYRPGLRPTRGSGLGGVVERFAVGVAGAAAGVEAEDEQPATQASPIANGATATKAPSAPRRRTDDSDFTGKLRFWVKRAAGETEWPRATTCTSAAAIRNGSHRSGARYSAV